MNLKDVLKAVAPTLATAILGPVGGLAVEVLGNALGMDEPTKDKIEQAFKSGQLTGDQVVAVKQAEQAFLARCKELDIDLERIHAGDRDSARGMQKETRSKIPGTLAILVTLGFFGVLGYLLVAGKPAQGGDALLVMLGALGTAWGAIVQFYFGSSVGSQNKDAALAKAAAR
jgi:hypothetical protein